MHTMYALYSYLVQCMERRPSVTYAIVVGSIDLARDQAKRRWVESAHVRDAGPGRKQPQHHPPAQRPSGVIDI